MLTDQDIDKLTSVLATKRDVEEIKSDLADLKETVQGLVVAGDAVSKTISDLSLEYAAVSSQVSRHDNQIKQIATKIDLKLVTD